MRLRNRLNIILSTIFIAVLSLFAAISYTMEHQQARDEVLQTARLILEMAASIRQYTIEEIAPLVNTEEMFHPQSVPAYAAISTFSHLKQRLKQYEYKESMLNPKNPIHRAAEWEVELIRAFRNETELNVIIGNRHTQTSDFLYLAMPMQLTDKKCLKCHDTSSNAPPEIVKKFGENGFGWKMNEILGVKIITVPTSLAHQKAQKSVFTLLISIICVFALIMVAINMMLKNSVVRPILSMSEIAEEISFGKKSVSAFPDIRIFEFKKLIAAIKRLKTSRDHTLNLLKQCTGTSTDPVQFNMQDVLSEPDMVRPQSESEIEM
ncbi:MAG: HAMP domain-containing protein [Candidatus Magnetoglobus multicellularis str. Araruama]|uniref:HAMP domain-containing protein n=1 Tax=Candidatus Magnetoglobus multicellularis str. Araruama TaxID=890399 RepID=A0A1V1P8U3_9BACT|nr:MAG: HAMP domain-containing protein [Candidatus Magnetoglobus multicellularis str. Araruama]